MKASVNKDRIVGNTILDTALEMAEEGLPVFPVTSKKTPAWSIKELNLKRGQGGFKMATTDLERVEFLFSKQNIAGIGVPTGKATGRTIVDVDCGSGKKERAAATTWLAENKEKLWGSTVVRTQSGGLQYYCKYTPDIPNAANVFGLGVDCRNDGGYVVVPPFMGYKFERQTEPDDWPAPPPVLFKKIKLDRPDDTSGAVPQQIIEMRDLIQSGVTWHDPVRNIVAHLVGSGWHDAEILRHVFTWTWQGHNVQDTFDEVCVMIEGARTKWSREKAKENRAVNAVDAIKKNVVKLTHQQRIDLHLALGKMIK